MSDRHTAGSPDHADATATARTADLAERILDEVSRARHSWPAIDRLARELGNVTARMVRAHEPPGDDAPPRAPIDRR